MSAGVEIVGDATIGRRALAKASWRILPLVALGYGVSFVDRVNIGFAALQMNRDLHFSATVYGLGAGLFFLGYAAFEAPSNMILVRVGARRWLSRIMVSWGVLSVGMLLVRTPAQFYLLRLALGVAEAGFFPGVIYYLGQWFPASHRGRTISWFYIAAPLSTVLMGALAGALLGLQGRGGLAGWQWLFLLEGAPAVILGGMFLVWLPDAPATAPWLTAAERQWLQARLDGGGDAPPGAAVGGRALRRTLRDPNVLALGAANFVVLGGYYCFNLSAPTYLAQIGGLSGAAAASATGRLVAVGGLLAAGAMLVMGWRSDRRGERFLHLAAPLALMAGAFALMAGTTAPPLVITAYLAAVALNGAVGGVFWSAAAEILDAGQAAVGVAVINTVGQIGSFVLPILWGIARDRTGSFGSGLALLPVGFLAAAAICLWLRRNQGPSAPSLGVVPAPPGAGPD
jgi:ACS family tartrate transporter-like MFS transporter